MNTGPGFYTAGCGARVEIKSTGDFHCFLVNDKRERVALAGPWSKYRKAKIDLPDDIDTVEVCVEAGESWSADWRAIPSPYEYNSGVKRAEHVEAAKTQEQTMREMVQAAVAAAIGRPGGEESEEEENDFEVDDDDELGQFGLSKYEIQVMTEEYLEARNQQTPPSSSAKPSSGIGDSESTVDEDGPRPEEESPGGKPQATGEGNENADR